MAAHRKLWHKGLQRCALLTRKLGLEVRRFSISPFQLGQQDRSLLFGSCFPHDLAAVYRLFLARWLSGCAIRQQIVDREWPGMRRVRIQCVDHRRPFLNDSNSRVAMAVDPPLMTLRQPKPSFKIEIVLDLFKLALADEKAGEEAIPYSAVGETSSSRWNLSVIPPSRNVEHDRGESSGSAVAAARRAGHPWTVQMNRKMSRNV